jgi:hypothetical protein
MQLDGIRGFNATAGRKMSRVAKTLSLCMYHSIVAYWFRLACADRLEKINTSAWTIIFKPGRSILMRVSVCDRRGKGVILLSQHRPIDRIFSLHLANNKGISNVPPFILFFFNLTAHRQIQ